jgi:hypothetical protein
MKKFRTSDRLVYMADFDESFASFICKGDTNGILTLGVDKTNVNDILVCGPDGPKIKGCVNIPSFPEPTPLIYAICCRQPIVVEQLIGLGANICAGVCGWRPIHFAAAACNFQILNFLLDCAPSEVNAVTDERGTPLHFSVSAGDIPGIVLLLARGADVNACNSEGRTALHMSMTLQDCKITEILLNFGAHLELKDLRGLTPLAVASQKQNTGILDFLRSLELNPPRLMTPEAILGEYAIPRERNGTVGMKKMDSDGILDLLERMEKA